MVNYFWHHCTVLKMAEESVFHFSIRSTLKNWTALQLAIEHGEGDHQGREKEIWLSDALEKYFLQNDNLYPDEVEDCLADILCNEFNTIAEDGSITQVSEKLCQYFEWCRSGQEDRVRESCSSVSSTSLQQSVCINEIPSEEQCNLTENPMRLPEIQNLHLNADPVPPAISEDNDGWTLVTSNRRTHK